MAAEILPAAPVAQTSVRPPKRPNRMLAARLHSVAKLNVPAARAAEKPRSVSATKPRPKLVEIAPKVAPMRRQAVLVPSKAGQRRGANVVPLTVPARQSTRDLDIAA
jgi:hypothetical protein